MEKPFHCEGKKKSLGGVNVWECVETAVEEQLIQSLHLYFSVRNLGRAHDEENKAHRACSSCLRWWT